MSKTHQQIKVLRISFVLYELFQKFRYLLLFKHSLNIFYQRRIKVISMMNNELFKNFTISCNHAIGTTQSYELSLRKYYIYFDMSLKELLEEAEEDEMKGVKWKHSRLKSKLVEYTSHVSKLCCRNRQKGNELHHLFLQVLRHRSIGFA